MKNKSLHNNHLKQNKFTVPKGYFDNLEDVVITKLKAEALQISTQTKLPKNYFNSIENNVLERIKKDKKSKIIKLIMPVAVAASILIALLIPNLFTTNSFKNISKNEMEHWLNSQLIGTSSLDIIAVQDDLTIETSFFEAVSDEEMVNYLNETDLEYILYEN